MKKLHFALLLLAVSAPLFGHHGTAASYDQKKVVKVAGTVKEFLWRNPHSSLYLDGKDAGGKPVVYALEMGSPMTLANLGYVRTSFKAGDTVSVDMHPSFTNPGQGEAVSNTFTINGTLFITKKAGAAAGY